MQNRSLRSYWRSPPGRLWRGTSCWAASQCHNLLGSLAAPQPAGQPCSATIYWAAMERHNLLGSLTAPQPAGQPHSATTCWAALQRHNLLGSLGAPHPAGQPRSATTCLAASQQHNLLDSLAAAQPAGQPSSATSCWAASQHHNLLDSLAAPQPAGQSCCATTCWAASQRHNLLSSLAAPQPPWIFPAFFRYFFKNFVLGPCGLFKVINMGLWNSVLDDLDSILHFPLSLYHFPPYPHFPLPKGQISLSTLLQEIYLWFFACRPSRPELWSRFWIKKQRGGKNNSAFFGHFF